MTQELITILIAASPVVELRGAIPLAITLFNFSPEKAYWLSVLGNLLPVVPLFLFLRHLSDYLMAKFYPVSTFLSWLFNRTRKYHSRKFENLGALALFIFVAIPLPFTGVWTAVVAAFVFGIPLKKAVFAISLGVLTAGAIVLLITLGIVAIL